MQGILHRRLSKGVDALLSRNEDDVPLTGSRNQAGTACARVPEDGKTASSPVHPPAGPLPPTALSCPWLITHLRTWAGTSSRSRIKTWAHLQDPGQLLWLSFVYFLCRFVHPCLQPSTVYTSVHHPLTNFYMPTCF